MTIDFLLRFSCRLATVAFVAAAMLSTGHAQAPAASPAATVSASPAGSPVAAVAKDDLIGVLKAAGNFKTFLKAIDAADLVSTLLKPGPLTVFAPTDTAFAKMRAGALEELLKPENKAKLVKVLSYHIASGKLTSVDLQKTDEVRTLESTEIDVDSSAEGKTIEVDDAKILGADIEATNGVLHAIDAVLTP